MTQQTNNNLAYTYKPIPFETMNFTPLIVPQPMTSLSIIDELLNGTRKYYQEPIQEQQVSTQQKIPQFSTQKSTLQQSTTNAPPKITSQVCPTLTERVNALEKNTHKPCEVALWKKIALSLGIAITTAVTVRYIVYDVYPEWKAQQYTMSEINKYFENAK